MYYIILIVIIVQFICSYFLMKLWIKKRVSKRIKNIYNDLDFIKKDTDNLIFNDINEMESSIRKYAKDTKLEIEQLKTEENYRKEFIGNISHELKTPLFILQNTILTLLETPVKKKVRKKYLSIANKSIERLTYVIKDLDIISQVEKDSETLNLKVFDIIDLINSVFEMYEIESKQKEISLVFDKKYAPINVYADKERIEQVVTNLVGNTIKYGIKKGTTEISIEPFIKNKILVRVTDNGIGIENSNLPRLFERFYRIEKSGNRDTGGSGLGLAIVKHIIEAHKEKIYVESQLNIGSEFSFTLEKSE